MSETEKIFKQRSAAQSAQRHQNFTVAILVIAVIIMLGVSIWLINMSMSTQLELESDPKLNVPITTSTAKIVTRKKEFTRTPSPIPTHKVRPPNTKPRQPMPPPTAPYKLEEPTELPPGTIIE
ncbi:MAG: hypothetical protein Q4F00_06555 [bacterium]|nr:hypothetical protein [bacterium]